MKKKLKNDQNLEYFFVKNRDYSQIPFKNIHYPRNFNSLSTLPEKISRNTAKNYQKFTNNEF